MNNVTFDIRQGLCHIVMFIKGSTTLRCSSRVMSHCDIGQGLHACDNAQDVTH